MSDIRSRTTFFSISFKGFGGNRKLKATQYETAADKQRTGAHMKLVSGPELARIDQIRHRTRNDLGLLAVPSPLGAQKGVYLMPIRLIGKAVETCRANREVWLAAWETFFAAYPGMIDAARKPKDEGGLGNLFDLGKYPTEAQLRSRRRFEWAVYDMEIPGEKLSDAIRDDEVEKMRDQWRDSGAAIRSALRVGLAELVDAMVYSLGANPDGKARGFHESLYEKMNAFLSVIDVKTDLIGDEALRDLTNQAREIMSMVTTPEQLQAKGDPDLREQVLGKFKQVAAKVGEFVEVKDRQFADADEED